LSGLLNEWGYNAGKEIRCRQWALRFCEMEFGTAHLRNAQLTLPGTGPTIPRYQASANTWESIMPILLLVGVPVFLLGGGYLIIHAMH
jgi:hypothetical protein